MTISKNTKIELDGTHSFKAGDTKYVWDDGFLGYAGLYSDSSKTVAVTIKLSGSNWDLSTLRMDGEKEEVVVNDTSSGKNRSIEYLWAGTEGSTIHLGQTYVDYLRGSDDADDKVTLGSAGAGAISLRGGDNTVTSGSGWVDSMHFRDGNDKVTVGSGGIGSIYTGGGNDTVVGGKGGVNAIDLGNGNNVFVGGAGWTGSVYAHDGNDKFTVKNGNVDVLHMGQGKNTLNVTGSAYINSVVAYAGNDTVNYTGSHDINTILLNDGKNVVHLSGSGNVNSIVTYSGDDTVTIGGSMQFVDSISLGGGANHVTTSASFVSSIITNEGDDRISIGGDGAGQISSWGGDDTVSTTSWVGSILLGNGDDTVSLLAGGTALSVLLRGGADSLSVSEVTSADVLSETCLFNGGAGTDSISFSAFTVGVTISLASADAVATGKGTFIIHNFENLTGGSGGDTLIGSSAANVLDGGAGNDTMTGGTGADTFAFAAANGNDMVTDFSKAEGDKIDLSGLTGVVSFTELSTGHMAQDGSDTVITGDNGETLTLKDVTMADLTADQFVF